MIRHLVPILTTGLAVGAWSSPAIAQVSTKAMTTAPVPGKSLPASQGPSRVARSFAAQGIEVVYLRAEAAEKAKVQTIPGSQVIIVTGVPEGDAKGYHPAAPNWKDTPAGLWGLDFVAKLYGSSLVISSEKEIFYIHHYYHLSNIVIEIPEGVRVIEENRKLTGEPTPDLSAPQHK